MLKIIRNDSWDFDDKLVSVVKMSSRGLTGVDKQAFLKRASAELFDKIASIEAKPGDVLIHAIALGATESWGPNRNGDGFTKAACKKYHNTFVTDARFYRNHKNTDPDKSYGIVKASSYNDEMDRVELIVALNGTKEAAARNGGKIADEELEKLDSGSDLPLSMAARVDYDVCSCCGHHSTTRDEYCTDKTCKAGGLKHNIGKMASVDGKIHHLHADNPHPTFIDISKVVIPADRTAYSYGIMKKGSSEIISGAELAEMYGLHVRNDRLKTAEMLVSQKQVQALRHLCDAVTDFHSGQFWTKEAAYWPVLDKSEIKDVFTTNPYSTGAVTKALSDARICLTPTQFLTCYYHAPLEKAAQVGEVIGPASNDLFMTFMHKGIVYNRHSMPEASSERLTKWAESQPCVRWSTGNSFVKQAAYNSINYSQDFHWSPEDRYEFSQTPYAQTVAEDFALYKLAFVSSLPQDQQQDMADLLVGRDYIGF